MSYRLGNATRQTIQTLTLTILVLGLLIGTVCVAQQPARHRAVQRHELLNGTVCLAQQPVADQPPVPEAQPAKQKPATEKPAEQKPGEEKAAEQKPAEQKATEQKPAEEKAAEQKPVEPKTTEPAVVEPEAAKPPAEGVASEPEAIVEGPETLAEKFAEILAKRLGDDAAGAGQKPDATPAPEPDETEAAPKQDPAEAAAAAELEAPTISVLVLRNPDDLVDVKPTDRIGQLILSGDEFTNRSLRSLKGLTILELSIEAVNISSAGLQYLQEVQGIRRLRLWSPGLDDQALQHVAELADLEILDIEGTAVEGTSLGDLKGLQKLDTLVLGPKFTDSQIAALEQLPALRQLDLRACGRLTLEGVESLATLADLKVIWLPRHVRTKGKRALRVSLPECEIRS